MDNREFNTLTKSATEMRHAMLEAKGREYSDGADRLVQFKRSAAGRGITPEEVLWGYMDKHLQALQMFIARLDTPTAVGLHAWDEKINDTQNYLDLLRGLLTDRFHPMVAVDIGWQVPDSGFKPVRHVEIPSAIDAYNIRRLATRELGSKHIKAAASKAPSDVEPGTALFPNVWDDETCKGSSIA